MGIKSIIGWVLKNTVLIELTQYFQNQQSLIGISWYVVIMKVYSL